MQLFQLHQLLSFVVASTTAASVGFSMAPTLVANNKSNQVTTELNVTLSQCDIDDNEGVSNNNNAPQVAIAAVGKFRK